MYLPIMLEGAFVICQLSSVRVRVRVCCMLGCLRSPYTCLQESCYAESIESSHTCLRRIRVPKTGGVARPTIASYVKRCRFACIVVVCTCDSRQGRAVCDS